MKIKPLENPSGCHAIRIRRHHRPTLRQRCARMLNTWLAVYAEHLENLSTSA